MNRVNPPKQRVLPESIQKDKDLKRAFDDTDFSLFQLWVRTGAGDDYIDSNQNNIGFPHTLARLFDIREQIGSGKPVTIDTTGFTIDNTEQTIDMTEV